MITTDVDWNRIKTRIPNGCQTLSKCPERYVNGIYPKLLSSGFGCEVFWEDKPYIDFISGLGAISIGYHTPSVDDAVVQSIRDGQTILSLPHPKEFELAQKLAAAIPYAEQAKFFKTGSECTSAAVRVARAFTGKTKVLTCGYNGWHDWCAVGYDRTAGIPSELRNTIGRFTYNDLASVEQYSNGNKNIAAVILEPVIYDAPRDGFLEKLVALAHKNGALVIFDEIVNGLRFGLSGSGGLLGVRPDLGCFSKGLGNGYPIAALVGRQEVMQTFEQPDFFVSGTFGGDLIGITAALAVLDTIRPDQIWANGMALKTGFNALCKDLGIEASCEGFAPRTFFKFPTVEHKALFWQECVKRSVLFGHANFCTQAHRQLVMSTVLNACDDALRVVRGKWANPMAALEGPVPVGVFR